MISNYEQQYMKIIENIIKDGYYAQNRTGIATKKLPHQVIQIDLQKEFPILKSKQLFWKTATKEILWIMQKQSNIVQDLRDVGVKVWNEWEGKDGTIGKAYGYQVKKYHQIDNLINSLKNNPQDRRMLINLWNNEDLNEMNLQPCCFLTIWDVTDGRLNCMLVQRSGDMGLGVPFNTTQYAILTYLIAQSCGLKVGLLTHVINNAHIYENHFKAMEEQLKRFDTMKEIESFNNFINKATNKSREYFKNMYKQLQEDCEDFNEYTNVLNSNPKLVLNPNIKDFYDFTIDDIKVEDYKHLSKISMEVAI